ncbi:hypothetical protein EJ05DRAFT_56280 [Pseudovirgaria hyperparasitica]|uniref:Protein SMG7 n=1 Tax=Pseudovirgaria hyperparasitica TaxID=470096 RepID=A0A6A6W5B4_9PEZI|nr:uncharacterized protein EJ05DRAFT_56280 [Pseudovirgaria hyperparasitica]KAF2757120.1 hypothetical protein EJ05DRAFT_56280 [Pseudovirgaria hyperparasitica]
MRRPDRNELGFDGSVIKVSSAVGLHYCVLTYAFRYRVDCEKIIFSNFVLATEYNIEVQLWNTHISVNDRFRKQVKRLRESGNNLIVERRKLLKEYLEFIKSSQLFYRSYILRLDQIYGGIPAIRKEAQNWKHADVKATSLGAPSAELRRSLRRSCYFTLIRLGDLSRYRASDIDQKPNWSPAVGYYNLAIEVNPDAPNAHNQQAIISRSENDHFRTLYYLYRSVSTKDGPDAAGNMAGNLTLVFKKFRTAWEKREPIHSRTTRDGNPAVRALVAWFIHLHSKCYAGEDFNEHDELESEVTSQLAVQIKERPLEGNLHKMVLINMSAEYFATTKLKESSPSIYKAYFLFLRLNVKTFFTLLQTLQSELERLNEGSGRQDVKSHNSSGQQRLSDRITVVAKRILPAVRLYSVWFRRNWAILETRIADFSNSTLTEVDVRELFKAYTSTLTLLTSAFPVEELPGAAEDYLLEEDADTIGYAPLISTKTSRNWYKNDELKKKWSDSGVERHHPNQEMLTRIRDLLIDGLELAQEKNAPIDVVDRRFVYREAGVPSEQLASPHSKAATSPDIMIDINDIPRPLGGPVLADDQASQSVAPSETTSAVLSKDTAMNRMVDNLVGSGVGDDTLESLQEIDENLPPTPPAQTFQDTSLVNSHSYGMTPITARDLVNTGDSYSRLHAGTDPVQLSTIKKTPGSPSVRQVHALPSLPDQSGIWNPTYPMSNPGSPYLGNATGLTSRNSTTSLNAFHRSSHSRNPSTNSNAYGPAYDPWSSSVTLPQTSSTAKLNGGNQQFGNYANGSPNPQYDPAMASSFLFGHSAWSSPASGAERQRRSLGRTPPNGQGG